jgi:DNA/RNA-binding domain of Phe-tRNA-synthetase-like protein
MPLQTHGSGLKLIVEESLRGVIAIGMLEAEDIAIGTLTPEFAAESERVITRLVGLYSGKQPADIPGVSEARALFHQLDVDPTKHRPSSEALLRRVLQGKGLPVVHPAVDVCNLCSLEHQIPLGLYDRDVVEGAVHVRAGREGEGYSGIRKQRVHLAGRLLLADDHGPFGAPTSDSLRTAVESNTRRLLVVLFCPMERAGQTLTGVLEHIAERLTRFCSARVVSVGVVQ